ncbi:hypothetical protein OKA04_08700 [Luteolibacter flavescens]|uniref:Uncharacterized protein n=1 Tax=Luteolibacter flavescens TaxID=1859460 RepID=A0ABT3FN88_9BACT|nr:hypothetical protein [Luteolibacter flavescens]MCW1884804.1 hypothetical protein [Luteolibacter flavescens]
MSRPGGAKLVFKGDGNYRDWQAFASRGLYAFDFHDVHRSSTDKRQGYDLIYRPEQPIMAGDLPENVRTALMVLPVVFGEGNLVSASLLGPE